MRLGGRTLFAAPGSAASVFFIPFCKKKMCICTGESNLETTADTSPQPMDPQPDVGKLEDTAPGQLGRLVAQSVGRCSWLHPRLLDLC